MGNQTVVWLYWLPYHEKKTQWDVNGAHLLFG